MKWDNYIMRKFGGSIRKKILEAYIPFAKAQVIKKVEERKEMITEPVWYSQQVGRC
jgi:hypothetical protein